MLIDKQPGLTSFQTLFAIKKELGTKKVGHTGTLDAFASGLLVVLVGKALKLSQWFLKLDKQYEAEILFGEETDTLDPEGEVVARAEPPAREAFEKIIPRFTGEIMQAPPAYSAMHIGGKRASELARAGKAPELPERPVTIYGIELLDWNGNTARISVHCSSGTYIRSLARDMARAAGSCARLSALRRTAVGKFLAKHTKDTKEFEVHPVDKQMFEKMGISSIEIDGRAAEDFRHGRKIETTNLTNDTNDNFLVRGIKTAAVFGESGGFCGIVEWRNGKWAYGYVNQDS